MKKITSFFVPIIILTIAFGVVMLILSFVSRGDIVGFEVRKEDSFMVLYKTFADQSSKQAGLKVPLELAGTYEVPVNIVVAPNKELVVFNEWHEIQNEILVAAIDGSNKRKIAEQEIPEGSGELLPETLQWSADGRFITYEEVGIQADGPGVLPSGELTANTVRTTYQVDITNGAKKKLGEREE